MTSNFKEAISITLKNEGGLSNNKEDLGGITKYGISLRFLKELDIDINGDGSINGKDIQDMTLDEAESIYKTQFWDKLNIGSIDNPAIANKVFDLSVNMGGFEAIKLLQRAINLGIQMQIKEDGIIGSMTLNILNNVNLPYLLNSYKQLAYNFYKELVLKKPQLQVFLDGWLNRANQ